MKVSVKYNIFLFRLIYSLIIFLGISQSTNIIKADDYTNDLKIIFQDRVNLKSFWVGKSKVKKDIAILLMAGHADSQGQAGSGTAGGLAAALALGKAGRHGGTACLAALPWFPLRYCARR